MVSTKIIFGLLAIIDWTLPEPVNLRQYKTTPPILTSQARHFHFAGLWVLIIVHQGEQSPMYILCKKMFVNYKYLNLDLELNEIPAVSKARLQN